MTLMCHLSLMTENYYFEIEFLTRDSEKIVGGRIRRPRDRINKCKERSANEREKEILFRCRFLSSECSRRLRSEPCAPRNTHITTNSGFQSRLRVLNEMFVENLNVNRLNVPIFDLHVERESEFRTHILENFGSSSEKILKLLRKF